MAKVERQAVSDLSLSEATRARVAALGPWFYDFEFPGGVRTGAGIPVSRLGVHETRLRMLEDLFEREPGLVNGSALDVGCHEGYFSLALRRAGFGRVVGVDLRPGHIEKARLAAELMGVNGLSFHAMDAEELDRDLPEETFGLALMFGLIYHLESPMRVLRQAAARVGAGGVVVIETQLSDEGAASVEWGHRDHRMPVVGSLAVVDESSVHAVNRETGATPLALCPSAAAVHAMLRAAGFGRTEQLPPHKGAHEQFARGRRGIFVGRRA